MDVDVGVHWDGSGVMGHGDVSGDSDTGGLGISGSDGEAGGVDLAPVKAAVRKSRNGAGADVRSWAGVMMY